jgi:DNA-binding MarR family transcriptional regulator
VTLELQEALRDAAGVIDDDGLMDLLAAYQFLQGQNIRMAAALSAHLDIGASDLRVLLFIERSPDATPKNVASQLEQASGSVTALLDRLERGGFVVRRPNPRDGRSMTLHLTIAGLDVVDAVRSAYRSAFAEVFSSHELAGVADTLRSLAGSLTPAIRAVGD